MQTKQIISQQTPVCIGIARNEPAGRLARVSTRFHRVNMLPDFTTPKRNLKRNTVKQHVEQIESNTEIKDIKIKGKPGKV